MFPVGVLIQFDAPLVFTDGDILHLRSNDAFSGIMHLAHIFTGFGTQNLHSFAVELLGDFGLLRTLVTIVNRKDGSTFVGFDISPV